MSKISKVSFGRIARYYLANRNTIDLGDALSHFNLSYNTKNYNKLNHTKELQSIFAPNPYKEWQKLKIKEVDMIGETKWKLKK